MVKKPKSAALYCRLSYAPDGSVEKVERQEADCRELAARLGWMVSERHVFVDNSRSAWKRNRKRPAWDRMLAAVDAGEIDGIVVYHGDRMIRQPFDLEILMGLAEGRGLRICSPSGTRDLDSADDRFILRIEAAGFCRASDDTSRRVKRGVKGRVAKGLPSSGGGHRPYGWGVQTGTRVVVDEETGAERHVPIVDRTLPVNEEISFIQRGVERQLAGMGYSAVVRWLNRSGSRTTEGNEWTPKSWRNVIVAPRVAGLIEHDGQLLPAAWDGALSVEVWEAVKAMYATSAAEQPYRQRERVHLLTGIAECHRCHKTPGKKPVKAADSPTVPACTAESCPGPHHTVQTKPTGGRHGKETRIYYCRVCRSFGRNLKLLDAYVDGRVLKLLSNEAFARELQKASEALCGPGLLTEITALEQRRTRVRAQLQDLADHPDVDPELAMLSVASFDRKIRDLRTRLAVPPRLRRLTDAVGITREQWLAYPMDVRSTIVRDLFRVVILPAPQRGPGLDTSSVRLERRTL